MITTTFINLWNKRLGAIAWNEDKQTANSQFEPSFLKY